MRSTPTQLQIWLDQIESGEPSILFDSGKINDADMKVLCEAIKKSTHLKELYFGSTNINSDLHYLGEALRENTNICVIMLGGNNVNSDNLAYMAECLSSNYTLIKFQRFDTLRYESRPMDNILERNNDIAKSIESLIRLLKKNNQSITYEKIQRCLFDFHNALKKHAIELDKLPQDSYPAQINRILEGLCLIAKSGHISNDNDVYKNMLDSLTNASLKDMAEKILKVLVPDTTTDDVITGYLVKHGSENLYLISRYLNINDVINLVAASNQIKNKNTQQLVLYQNAYVLGLVEDPDYEKLLNIAKKNIHAFFEPVGRLKDDGKIEIITPLQRAFMLNDYYTWMMVLDEIKNIPELMMKFLEQYNEIKEFASIDSLLASYENYGIAFEKYKMKSISENELENECKKLTASQENLFKHLIYEFFRDHPSQWSMDSNFNCKKFPKNRELKIATSFIGRSAPVIYAPDKQHWLGSATLYRGNNGKIQVGIARFGIAGKFNMSGNCIENFLNIENEWRQDQIIFERLWKARTEQLAFAIAFVEKQLMKSGITSTSSHPILNQNINKLKLSEKIQAKIREYKEKIRAEKEDSRLFVNRSRIKWWDNKITVLTMADMLLNDKIDAVTFQETATSPVYANWDSGKDAKLLVDQVKSVMKMPPVSCNQKNNAPK
jgi:hypothetical protein